MANATPSESTQASVTETLPAVSGITCVNELFTHYQNQVRDHRYITVDASAVERITTPCVQLLVAVDHALKEKDGHLHLANPSEAFLASMSTLGLASVADEWSIPHE